MKKILITGSEGFIGSHLVEYLVFKGYNVKAFVLYNSFNSWGWLETLPKEILKEVEIFTGDLRDTYAVRKAMENCYKVIHLGALIAIPYSYHSPESYIDVNIKGTLNILQASLDFDIEKVVHTSTSEVYGSAKYVPMDELHPLFGQSPYSASKIGADQLVNSFYTSFKLPAVTLRPFNTFGPRQSARAIIPTIITQLLKNKGKIKLGLLSPTRDFNYIKDIVRGFERSLQSSKIIGETINLGTGFEISIKDLVNLIASNMNVELIIASQKSRLRPKKSEVNRLLCDNSKAKLLLNWQPQYNNIQGLKKALNETVEWFSNEENLKLYKSDINNI